jgi:hypothetical protein
MANIKFKDILQEGKTKLEGDEIFYGVTWMEEDENGDDVDGGFSIEGDNLDELYKSLLTATKDVKNAISTFKKHSTINSMVR